MRAAWNTTCDLVWGPSQPGAGLTYFTGACRLVPQIRALQFHPYMGMRTAYITLIGAGGNVPQLLPGVPLPSIDYGWADRVAIPAGSPPAYRVMYSETVTPVPGGPFYFRISLRALLGPPMP